ncbi:hypothetical protein B0H11DRAFT_1937148 [Mycena galericulata]|nr:hypothetical protein B0H11DRAFT_1937148 [Mycena galericulata]
MSPRAYWSSCDKEMTKERGGGSDQSRDDARARSKLPNIGKKERQALAAKPRHRHESNGDVLLNYQGVASTTARELIFVHAMFDTRVFLQLAFKRLIHLQLSDPVRYAPYGSNPSQTHCGTPIRLHSELPSTTEYWQTEVPPTTKPVCYSFASSSSRAELTRVIYEMCLEPASANYLTFLTMALCIPQAWYQVALHTVRITNAGFQE